MAVSVMTPLAALKVLAMRNTLNGANHPPARCVNGHQHGRRHLFGN